ncbi:L,D-transpeptidase [Bifidobacterium callitrichos]
MDRESEYIGRHRSHTDLLLIAQIVICAVLAVILCMTGLMWHARTVEADRASVAAGAPVAEVETAADRTVDADTADTARKSAKSTALTRGKVPAVNQELARARWTNPTGGAQPDLSRYRNLSIDVSLAKQRVYIKSNGETIYSMIVSTGMNDTTPHGSFTIGVRGDHFYNPEERMGADYWVRITGPYLFHSVPTNENAGQYLPDEGDKLGRPASHGCVRLSIADAKWFYDQIPSGTPVTIA